MAEAHGEGGEETAAFLIRLFLQDDLPDEVRGTITEGAGDGSISGEAVRRVAHAVFTLPEFQLN